MFSYLFFHSMRVIKLMKRFIRQKKKQQKNNSVLGIFLFNLSSVLWCTSRFPHENDVRLVLTSSCLYVMSYLRYLCLFVHSAVERILCGVFVLFFFVLYTPVSLDCPFLIVPSVFSNVYSFCFHFKSFIDKSIGLDNRLCLCKSSPTTRWNN